jgi:hypothetical protein
MGKQDLNRAPQIAILDTKTNTAKYIPLNHMPAEKIFDLEGKNKRKAHATEMEEFVGQLDAAVNFEKKTLENELEALELPPDVLNSVHDYLTKAKES